MEIDRDEAERFLLLLDPSGDRFTFQTFDDNQDRKDKALARILHGPLARHFEELCDLNDRGAGIFVTVNVTDLKGRTISNIIGIRAVFVDLDGAPLDPVLAPDVPEPHIVTETSPSRWHCYWRVENAPLAEFEAMQKLLIATFDGDKSIHDLPRVMRIPGFIHRKADAFLSRLSWSADELPSYDFAKLRKLIEPLAPQPKPAQRPYVPPPPTDDRDMPDRWRALNSEALSNLGAWVPTLFPSARRYHEGFRVSSKNLFRNFEEDLSFRSNGIKDFGVHDMGDAKAGARTPIDIVMEHHRTDFPGAVKLLATALGRDPQKYEPQRRSNGGAVVVETVVPPAVSQPLFAYAWRPFSEIPARQWLHAKHYVRRYVVMTVAPGGYGKSSLLLCNAIEMATGVGLIGPNPIAPVRTAYWNAEEAETEEVERRIAALCLAHNHKIKPEMLVGNLFLGAKISTDEWRFAMTDRFGRFIINTALVKLVTEFIGDNQIGCAMFDPMVAFHNIAENDTGAMQLLVKAVIEPIGIKTNACLELSHHTRKPSGGFGAGEITADESRGAGAAVAASRSVRVLNRMTAVEAENANIKSEERRLYLRISRDKANMSPPDKARWVKLIGVELGNDSGGLGDTVQAVVSWAFPKAFDGVSAESMHFMRALVSKGEYRADSRSPEWVGFPLIRHLGLKADDKGTRKKTIEILKTWIESGVLAIQMRPDEQRKPREYVVAGSWRDPEETQQNELFEEH